MLAAYDQEDFLDIPRVGSRSLHATCGGYTLQVAVAEASRREVFVSTDVRDDAPEGLTVKTDSTRAFAVTFYPATEEQLSGLGLQSQEAHLAVLQASAGTIAVTFSTKTRQSH